MWPSPEFQWLVSAIALAAIGAAWLLFSIVDNHRPTRIGNIVGGIGAGVAALGIVAVLKPVPGITAKEIFAMWLVSLSMISIAIFLVSQGPSRLRWGFVACGVLCLMLNVWSIMLLLWIATVSPGGV